MTWVLVVGLAVLCFGAIAFLVRVPAGAREALAAALLLGIAGYALQGSPSLPDAPRAAPEKMVGNGQALVAARQAVSDRGIPSGDRWVIVADGLARNGQYADAADVLRGAVKADQKNAEAWVALGNALLAHAEGQVTPAALYSYRRASLADPADPSPPFFLGLALAQSGKLTEARALWAALLQRAPADAAWRPLLAQRIAQLDRLIAELR